MSPRKSLVVFLSTVALALAACSAAPSPTGEPSTASSGPVSVNPGKLTIAVDDLGNERFDIFYVLSTGPGHNYAKLMHGYLIEQNEGGELTPGIASDWSLSDDGLTWTFTIRSGVKFHDGSELTAEDVLWSFQHYFGPGAAELTPQPNVAQFAELTDRIELTGPNQVSWTSKEPVPQFALTVSEADNAWFPIMPKRSAIRDEDADLAYEEDPIGAGPMRLVSHSPGAMMQFERFDDYYHQPKYGFSDDKRMNFSTLDLVLLPDEASRAAAVEAGDVDLASVSLGVRDRLEAAGARLVFASEGAAVDARLYGCKDAQYPCHDERVRLALDLAINKETVQTLFGGPEVFQIKGWVSVTPSTFGYTPALDPRPFDPDMARDLLAEAGYPGGDGFGTLTVQTFASQAMPNVIELAQLIADMWHTELGLDVEVEVGEVDTIEAGARAGESDGKIVLADTGTRQDATRTMTGKYADPEEAFHDDPDILRMAQETFATFGPERKQAYEKLFVVLRDLEMQPAIGYVNIPWAVGSRVVDWRPYGLKGYPSALYTLILKAEE